MKKIFLSALLFTCIFQGFAQQNCEEKGPAGTVNTEYMPFRLLQNFPNPAKQNTSIKFHINCSGTFSLQLFDMLGNPLFSLLEGEMAIGTYTLPVDVEGLADGIYFYVLKKGRFSQTMKMIVSREK